MTYEFSGLVAAITGGASGIGLATALELTRRGAAVAVIDLHIDDLSPELFGVIGNVSDRSSINAAIDQIALEFGALDILINNAGIGATGDVTANDDDEWHRVLDINVVGMARTTTAALPHLRRSAHAAIVNLCSIAALNGLPDRALYSASKAAVLGLTFAMATDHVHEGIRVNCVRPGTVSTTWVDKMVARFDDPIAERAALDARQATGRMVTPEEVADAIAYLASPRSGSTTGTALDVDGGVTHLRIRPRS